MEVILQQDVENLGTMGEVVKVKPGYARNYLLPRGLALVADRKNLARLEHQKRAVAALRAKAEKAAQEEAAKLAAIPVTIPARVGEEDRLFGSVTNQDIQRALAARGVEVERKKILLAAPIKSLGEFEVPVSLGAGVRATVKVSVVRQEE
ncbi:MAG: 50S ribosomal protein L9 [Candidatus Binatia bacterium]